jgi:hypothetical protein
MGLGLAARGVEALSGQGVHRRQPSLHLERLWLDLERVEGPDSPGEPRYADARNDGESNFSEITSFSESPVDPLVLWVGTDDGNVQVSIDGGRTWTETSKNVSTPATGSYVGRVIASAASRGSAYVVFDLHRSGDFAPYILRTTDFGTTWKPMMNGLPPNASVRSIAEYPGKANVVFAGTERHLFMSRDSAATWTQLSANLPTTRYDEGSRAGHAWPQHLAARRCLCARRVHSAGRAEEVTLLRRAARDADAVLGRHLERCAWFLYRRQPA